MNNDDKERAIKPDAQGFDEIRIVTVPRYKQSELSGDEWRISATIQFWRKGQIVHEYSENGSVQAAIMHLGFAFNRALDNGFGLYCGERDVCDQEGCSAKAIVTYRLKKQYDNSGNGVELIGDTIRQFCSKHETRGDCGLEDADANYETLT